MSVQSLLIEATIPANATNRLLWNMTCPTTMNRKILEIRDYFTGAGVMDLVRETDTQYKSEKTISDFYKRPQVLEIDWGAGVTMYLYGTDRSGASNSIKMIIIYEETPV